MSYANITLGSESRRSGPLGGPHRKRVILALIVALVLGVVSVALFLPSRQSTFTPHAPATAPVRRLPAPVKAAVSKATSHAKQGTSTGTTTATSSTGTSSSSNGAAAPSGSSTTAPTCGADATATLQSLINRTPNGGTISLTSGACYDVEGTLLVNGRSDLTIDGRGATLRAITQGSRSRMFIKIRASNNVVLKNITLWGPNASGVYNSNLEAQHGVGVFGATNAVIENINVKQVYGDGVTLTKAGDGSRAPEDNVTIKNSTFRTIGRQGISVVFASNIVIAGNTFDRVARSVIDLEPDTDSYVINTVLIEGNRSEAESHLFVAGGGAGCNTSHITIRNNDSDGGAIAFGAADVTCHKKDIDVEGNTFRLASGTNKGWWAYFWRVDDVTVRNNRILTTRAIPGVRFLEAAGTLVVSGNTFTGTCDVYDADQSSSVQAYDNSTASPCPPPPKSG